MSDTAAEVSGPSVVLRPIDPSELHTIDSLHADTGIPVDTLYDVVRDTAVLGRPVGFKIGRRWFIHPDDWTAYVAAKRGFVVRRSDVGDSPTPTPDRRSA
jgi:hypothetical protein